MPPPMVPPRAKVWIALTGFIDQNNDVTNICEGTNKNNNLEYYLDAQAPHRRLPRPGTSVVGRVSVAAVKTAELAELGEIPFGSISTF